MQGNPDSMVSLGIALLDGIGTAMDPVAARGWLEKAAEAGHASGMMGMARIHLEGLGVAKDQSTGLAWITKAAQAGDSQAQGILTKNGMAW